MFSQVNIKQTSVWNWALMALFLSLVTACASTGSKKETRNEKLISEVSRQIQSNQSALAKANLLKIEKPVTENHRQRLADLLLLEAKRGISCSVSVVDEIQKLGVSIGLESYYLFGKQLSLCHPLLEKTINSESVQASDILRDEIVDQTRLKRFGLISNLHQTALKKQNNKISLDQYAQRLVIIAYIHSQLAKGLSTSLESSAQLCKQGQQKHCLFEKEIKDFVSEVRKELDLQEQQFKKLSTKSSDKDKQVAWGLINLSFSPYLKILK